MISVTDVETYEAALAGWRAQKESELRAPEGWLSVAGLTWLDEGESTLGSDPACDVVLPAGAAPALLARLALRDGAVTVLWAAPELLVNGGPALPGATLRGAASGKADRIIAGRLALQIHQSGAKVGVRVRDPEHLGRVNFPGRRWFPARPEYRLAGRFVPYELPRKVTIINLLGDEEARTVPGYVAFTLDGQELRLDLWDSVGPTKMIVFRDATSGVETYGAARFLYVEVAPDGSVDLDFNKAVSPPCAFTPFATCPLPPPQNRLAVPIRAGELASEGH